MSEKPEDKIVRLMRDSTTGRLVPAPSYTIDVSGDGNIVAGRDVNIHHAAPTNPRPKVVVQTGQGVIDAKQKAELTARLKYFVTARNLIRVKKMTMGAAWSALNAHVGVNSYHEMTPAQCRLALAWIARQTRILGSMKSAPLKLPHFRNEAIAAIKARSRELGDLNYYRPHIAKEYGLTSLTAMSDHQLQELRAWIMRQKRR